MAPHGPLYPSSVVDHVTGYTSWTNPGYAAGASDGNYASVSLAGGSGGSSDALYATNCAFNVPDNAVIDGITVAVLCYGTNADTQTLQLMQAGAPVGSSLGNSTAWNSSAAWLTYGGPTNLWGATWTPDDINNNGFGVSLVVGPVVSANNTAAYVDAFGITVYWHVPTADVPTRFLYQVFNSSDSYVGLLPIPSNDFALSQEINTSGSQITIDVPVSADTAPVPVDDLTDESGDILTDETGANDLTTENRPPIVDSGTSSTDALIKNGNHIKVYRFDSYNPNGKCVFLGHIERWEATFGGNDDDKITVICYSDGADFDNHLVRSSQVLDQSQTSTMDHTVIIDSSNTGVDAPFETITPGAGVTDITTIVTQLSSQANPYDMQVRARLYASRDGMATNLSAFLGGLPADATAYVTVPPFSSFTDYTFNFSYAMPYPGAGYVVAFDCDYVNGVAINASSVAPSGDSAGHVPSGVNSLYFETYHTSAATNASFTSIDPSTMLTDIIGVYNNEKGLVTTSSNSVDQTGLSLSYGFNVNTVTDGIQACLSMAPYGFYYYVDLGTNTLYFKRSHTTPDLIFIKGRHMVSINIVATIENIKNTAFVSGGVVSSSNIYVSYQDATSVNRYGIRIDRLSDVHITDTTTAKQVATADVDEYKDEQYQTVVTVVDKTTDLTQLKPGLMVGFSGFGTFIDNMQMQIVRVDFTPETATLTLGLLPKRLLPSFEKVVRGLVAQQTINNPSTPS